MKFESLPQGVRLAVEAAQEKKAAGITVLDLTAAGAFTDYFVVCTGFSAPLSCTFSASKPAATTISSASGA